MKRVLFLLPFAFFISLRSNAFDGIQNLTCAGKNVSVSIQIYDNTSNGVPVIKETFAVVSDTTRFASWNQPAPGPSSYVLANSGTGFTYSISSDGTASFTDKANNISYNQCIATTFVPALRSKPREKTGPSY